MRGLAVCLLIVGLTIPTVAWSKGGYHQHKGFFAAVGLGMAEANFDMESGNDEADGPLPEQSQRHTSRYFRSEAT